MSQRARPVNLQWEPFIGVLGRSASPGVGCGLLLQIPLRNRVRRGTQ